MLLLASRTEQLDDDHGHLRGAGETDAGTITNEATVASTEDSDTDDDTVVVVEDVDLEIAKSFADDEVTAGVAGTHTFSLLVENSGIPIANNVTVVDAAPAGLTFISEDSPNCREIVAGDLFVFFLLHLGPNSSTTITVTYEVPATTDAGTITNEATVASTEDSDTDDDTVVVVEVTTLTASKTDGKTIVVAGTGGTTRSVTPRNDGPSARMVSFWVRLYPSAPFVAGTPSSNLAADCSTSSGNVIHCELSAGLAAAATWTVTVPYTVPANATATSVHNTATFTTDEVPGGTSASDDTDVVRNADLSITKTDSADPVVAGTNLVYTHGHEQRPVGEFGLHGQRHVARRCDLRQLRWRQRRRLRACRRGCHLYSQP